MARDWYTLGLLVLVTMPVTVSGCSGKAAVDAAEAADAPVKPVVRRTGASLVRTAKDSAAPADSAARANEIEVMRETFAYQGGARDPFNSLVTGLATGPELADLQLVGVYEDLRTPSNSVVILRQKQDGKRFKMRAGDQLGRMRLAQIRPREAVFMIQDLGFERQETLSLRKQEEATP